MAKFRLYRRGDAGMYYLQDNETGRQESLKTRRTEEARRVLNARNEAAAVPEVTRKIAAAYLWASDPAMKHRMWQTVMNEFSNFSANCCSFEMAMNLIGEMLANPNQSRPSTVSVGGMRASPNPTSR